MKGCGDIGIGATVDPLAVVLLVLVAAANESLLDVRAMCGWSAVALCVASPNGAKAAAADGGAESNR